MWHNKGCQWHGFGDTFWNWIGSIFDGRKCTVTHKEKHWSGILTKCCVQRGILLPTAVNPGCRQTHKLNRNGCYTVGYGVSSSAENSQKVSIFFRQLSVWNNSGVVTLSYQYTHKVQHLINNLWSQVTYTKSVSRTPHYFQSEELLNVRT